MLTLEEVHQAFSNYRATKKYLRSKIPQNLWDMVIQIWPHYKSSQIRKTLGINNKILRHHCHGLLNQETNLNVASNFIAASLPAITTCDLSVNLNDKTLALKIPLTNLREILPTLVGLL